MTKIEILKSMLTSDQRNAPVWLLLGLEHAEQGDRTEALQAFTQALAYGNEAMKEKIVIELNKLQKESPYSRTLKGIHQKDSSTYTMFPPKIRVIEGGKGKTTAKSVQLVEKTAGFGMVGGLGRVKEAIFQRLLHPISQRLPQKKSTILLYGPSGCGKSLLAKATAEECQAHFVSMTITGGRSMYTPSNRQFNIHDLLATVPANKPFLFFLDELDASSHYEEHPNSYHRQGIDSQWLQQIAETGEYDERFVLMGATNVPWELEPSMLRAAGFDHWIFVGPPDRKAREDIFRLKLEGRPSEMLDYEQLAGWTEFYSGADIEYVVELATEQVWHDIVTKGDDRPIQMSDLREAIAATYPTTIEWLRTLKEHLKQVDYNGIYDEVWDYLSLHSRI